MRDPTLVDFTLGVTFERRSAGVRLRFELSDGSVRNLGEVDLSAEPYEYFAALLTEMESLEVDPEEPFERRTFAEQRMAAIGERLTRELLPPQICEKLESHSFALPNSPAPTLWIITEEHWIPWEIIRLQKEDAKAFLGEAFALTRWRWDLPPASVLPQGPIGTTTPVSARLPRAAHEMAVVEKIGLEHGREHFTIAPRHASVLAALRSGRMAVWHYAGHCSPRGANPDLWSLPLDENETLRAVDLTGIDLSEVGPLIVLDACRSVRAAPSLTGLGGLAQAFLEAGAGAVVGTQWSVRDSRALVFAEAFYPAILSGESIGESTRQGRLALKGRFPGDSAWLAYSAFGLPDAVVAPPAPRRPAPRCDEPGVLSMPTSVWQSSHSPGALLRADHGVVPFHGRRQELEELGEWCTDDRPLSIQLITGRGGMGKTRLAIEICRRFRDQGWRSGFVPSTSAERRGSLASIVDRLVSRNEPLLAVIDYAEQRRDFLRLFLERLSGAPTPSKVRLLLLSRDLGDWWRELLASPGRVRDPLMGPAKSHRSLAPLAEQVADRAESFRKAARAFAAQLGRAVPEGWPERLPGHLDDEPFGVALLLHIVALGAVEGVELKSEDGALDWVLERERAFWLAQIEIRQLPKHVLREVGRVLAAIYLAGGVSRRGDLLELFSRFPQLAEEPKGVLEELAQMLHETYPSERFVHPLQPDILGEHLIERECEDNPQEIFDIVFGPRESVPPAAAESID